MILAPLIGLIYWIYPYIQLYIQLLQPRVCENVDITILQLPVSPERLELERVYFER